MSDDAPVIMVLGVPVRFDHRDARYVTEAERVQLERMVAFERSCIGPHQEVRALRVHTGYLGAGSRVTFTLGARASVARTHGVKMDTSALNQQEAEKVLDLESRSVNHDR